MSYLSLKFEYLKLITDQDYIILTTLIGDLGDFLENFALFGTILNEKFLEDSREKTWIPGRSFVYLRGKYENI